ncbi:MAG: hypothetical protein MUF31_04290 [Akkermansiaceae bacterium]|jgi:hypothetical protein|nr:hypothetical protein [Akkermansiaceae bacterium]
MSGEEAGWDAYPPDGLSITEQALFEVWDRLEKFRADLVVVGGLAVHYHTCRSESPFYPAAPTLDVDFGISLGTDAGMKGTVQFDLIQAGYQEVESRMVKTLENGRSLYVDFLTEHPPRTTGSRNVSDIVASICPGIGRALEDRELVEIRGIDQFGDDRTYRVPICGIGPLLVLKLNAFAGRTHDKKAKDAYDILALVSSYSGGPLAAIEAFHREKEKDNPAMEGALECLAKDFQEVESLGPGLAMAFRFGPDSSVESGLRLREDLVSIARAMLD